MLNSDWSIVDESKMIKMISSLTKTVSSQEDTDFRLEKKHQFKIVLFGVSGSGKTTFVKSFKLIHKLMPLDEKTHYFNIFIENTLNLIINITKELIRNGKIESKELRLAFYLLQSCENTINYSNCVNILSKNFGTVLKIWEIPSFNDAIMSSPFLDTCDQFFHFPYF